MLMMLRDAVPDARSASFESRNEKASGTGDADTRCATMPGSYGSNVTVYSPSPTDTLYAPPSSTVIISGGLSAIIVASRRSCSWSIPIPAAYACGASCDNASSRNLLCAISVAIDWIPRGDWNDDPITPVAPESRMLCSNWS